MEKFNAEEFEKVMQPIDETRLLDEMAIVSTHLSYYGQQEQEWLERHDAAKYAAEVRGAKVLLEHRANTPKANKETGDASISLDEEHQKYAKIMLQCKAQKGKYTAAVNALEARLKALQSMGSNKRSELSSVSPSLPGYHSGGFIAAGPAVMPYSTVAATTSELLAKSAASAAMNDEARKALAAKLTAKSSKL